MARDISKEEAMRAAYEEKVRQGIKSVVAEIVSEILPIGRKQNADPGVITTESMAKNKPSKK